MKRREFPLSTAFWLFALTFAVRIFALTRLSDSPFAAPDAGDMKFYHDWALRILHGQWTDGRAFYGLPGYAYLLALIYGGVGVNPFAVGLLQSAAEGATAVFIWKIGGEVFRSRAIGMIAAAGWAFFQPAQTFSIILMPTAWLIAIFWFCVWQVIKAERVSLWRPWLGLGLLIGVTANVIATVLFLIPLVIARIAQLNLRAAPPGLALRRTALSVLLTAAAVFAGTSPCWLHNYFVAHEPVMLSAHSGINFYIGNNEIANGYPKIPPGMRAGQAGMLQDSITMAEAASGRPLKRVEVSEFWSHKARDFIHTHFGDWLVLMAKKLRNFWNVYQYDDLSLVTLFARSGILLPGPRFGLIAALGIAGAIMALKQTRARWIIAAVLLHMCALLPVFVTERYRLAVVPGLLLLASFGLCRLWNSIVSQDWRAIASYVALSAAAALFVSWPQTDPGLWSLDYYNTGIKETEAGKLDRAEEDLRIAYAYVSDNSEINFALGNVALAKGERTTAKQFYRRAVEINARHSGAYNNLGVLAMEEERWPLAETFLTRSLRIEPDDAKTHYLLARTQLHMGNFPAASSEIELALRLKPQQPEFQALAAEIHAKFPQDHDLQQ